MEHPDRSRILGVWHLTAAYVVFEKSGERILYFGDAPSGCIVFDPSGRIFALITRSDREPSQTEAGRAALHTSMLSYSGTFTLDDEKFTTTVDLAWEPSWVGTQQVRFYTVTPTKLSIHTSAIEDPAQPGDKMVAYLEWARK
jgi:Lipocalin-like domain